MSCSTRLPSLDRLLNPAAMSFSGVAALLLLAAALIVLPPGLGPHELTDFLRGKGALGFASVPWMGLHLVLDVLLIAAYAVFLASLALWLAMDLTGTGKVWAGRLACWTLPVIALLALSDLLEDGFILMRFFSDWPGIDGSWRFAAGAKILLGGFVVISLMLTALIWFFSPGNLDTRRAVAAIVGRSKYTWLMLLGFALLLVFMEQTHDVVIRLAEEMTAENWRDKPWMMFILSFPAIFLFGLASWLWPRLLALMSQSLKHTSGSESFAKWWARLLGLFPFLATSLLFAKAGSDAARVTTSADSGAQSVTAMIALLGGLYVFAAGLYLVLIIYRRGNFLVHLLVKLFPFLASRFQPDAVRQYHNAHGTRTLRDVRAEAPFIYWLLWIMLFVLFVLAVMGYEALGALNQILFGLGFLSLILGLIGYWTYRHMRPYALFGLAWIGLLGYAGWSENHGVRTLDEPVAWQDPRSSLNQAWKSWLDQRLDKIRNLPEDQVYPVVLVSAEGGGIRAAYWTASVLMQNGKRFADHTFTLSTVSGSSVGAAAYFACLHETGYRQRTDTFNVQKGQQCLHERLNQDYLSPTLGKLLSTDLLAKFLPSSPLCKQLGLLCKDRAAVFEEKFEHALAYMGTALAESRSQREHLPYLLLNATRVENGKLAVASDIRIAPDAFPDSEDQLSMLGRDMRLSTAAHNSARFTYVNAVGTMMDEEDKVIGHLADGGYADNSGTRTIRPVFQELQRCILSACAFNENDRALLKRKLRPVVLHIGNEPVSRNTNQRLCFVNRLTSSSPIKTDPVKIYAGLLAPPLTVFNTWDRHRWEDLRTLQREAFHAGRAFTLSPPPAVCEIPLVKDRRLYPLGWVLSRSASEGMRVQAEQFAAYDLVGALEKAGLDHVDFPGSIEE